MFTAFDTTMMQLALRLAERGLGRSSPNPAVGAVVVKGRHIIGKGFHRKAGGPHAEVVALRQAKRCGYDVRNATLYVTLEPCSTAGRTPACTEAIVAAGIKRVVVAAKDPNPKHSGAGFEILRRAGLRVETGLMREEATRLNEAFNKWIVTKLPFVIVKSAMSLDGKIATRTGESKWISSEQSRRLVNKLRSRVDAVMVGAGTVSRDDPSLTVRVLRRGIRRAACRQPRRIVVDSTGRTPLTARVYNDAFSTGTLVLTTSRSAAVWREALIGRGVKVIALPLRKGKVDLRAAIAELGRREITSVLVEGGGELVGGLVEEGLVDKVLFFYAPRLIGGRDAPTAVEGEGVARLADAVTVSKVQWRNLGGDLVLTGYLR